MATLSFLKIKVFLNKDYYVITFVRDITNKVISREWKYIIDLAKVLMTQQFNKNLTWKPLFWGVVLVQGFATDTRYDLCFPHSEQV